MQRVVLAWLWAGVRTIGRELHSCNLFFVPNLLITWPAHQMVGFTTKSLDPKAVFFHPTGKTHSSADEPF